MLSRGLEHGHNGHGLGGELEYDGYFPIVEEPPVHVHSQACQDSCPVQDVYTEARYSRFSKGARTNLYGLAVVKELGDISATDIPVDATAQQGNGSENAYGSTQPSTDARQKISIFTSAGDIAFSHLPGRYALVAAGGNIKCFMGVDESFEFLPGANLSGFSTAGVTTGDTIESGGKAEAKGAPSSSEENEVIAGGASSFGSATSTSTGGSAVTAPLTNQEIISMDAFERKDERGCQLVLVFAIAKGEDPTQFELRIFGANTFGTSVRELLLKLPATTDIQSIPLSWAPTKIAHAPLENDPFEMAILVGGSDSCVHFFVQDGYPSNSATGLYEERPISTHFSVLASFSHCEYCVLSLVIKDYPTYRIAAAGTQNGTLNVGIIPRNPKTLQLDRANARSHIVVLFAPITTLTVYTSRVQAERSHQRKHSLAGQKDDEGAEKVDCGEADEKEDEHQYETEQGIHLLVTCAIEQAWVYSDITKHGLSRRSDLAECSYHDSILAAHIMDADWDGRNEVLIGTYGRQLMVFKELPPGQGPYTPFATMSSASSIAMAPTHPRSGSLASTTTGITAHDGGHRGGGRDGGNGGCSSGCDVPCLGMTWNRRFASPVYGISCADLNDDGLEELVITTLNGVSIFLPDPVAAKRRLDQAVERMQEIEEMRRTLEKLRKGNEELLETQRKKEKAEEEERLVKEQQEKQKQEDEERLAKEQQEKEKQKDEERLAENQQEKERKEKEYQEEEDCLVNEKQEKEQQEKKCQEKEQQKKEEEEEEEEDSLAQEQQDTEEETEKHLQDEDPKGKEREENKENGHEGAGQDSMEKKLKTDEEMTGGDKELPGATSDA
ncbi:hypothetical protein BGZ50_002376 [Haplosporangium sp. Z 11]|nr:hypothetical protein BGZ50_002376 [Haplosporangium sp. Z 11]